MKNRTWIRLRSLILCTAVFLIPLSGCTVPPDGIPDHVGTEKQPTLSADADANTAILITDRTEKGVLTGADTGLSEIFPDYIDSPAEAGGRLWYLGEQA